MSAIPAIAGAILTVVSIMIFGFLLWLFGSLLSFNFKISINSYDYDSNLKCVGHMIFIITFGFIALTLLIILMFKIFGF